MTDIIDYVQLFKEQSPNLSQNTYKTMGQNWKRLKKILKIDNLDEAIENGEVNSPKSLVNKIKSEFALNTTIQTILGINKLLELEILSKYDSDGDKEYRLNALVQDYNKYLKICCNRNQAIINENKLTAKEKDNWINYDTLYKMFVDYIENNKPKGDWVKDRFYYHRNILMLGLYILIPPTRIGNYQYMKLHYGLGNKEEKLSTEFNWLLMFKGSYYLLFNKYKTSHHIGSVHKKIGSTPNEQLLIKLIENYIEVRDELAPNMSICNTFLMNIYCSEITQNKFTDILKSTTKKIYNKELSVDLFRKIFITNYMKKAHSISENMEVAKFMGQTYNATMMEKYRKIDTPDEQETKNPVMVGFD